MEFNRLKKYLSKPYRYSIIAVLVSLSIGIIAGAFIPPNSNHVQLAYESGLQEGIQSGKSEAQAELSSKLQEQEKNAESSLSSALASQEQVFSSRLSSATKDASSKAYDLGKEDCASSLFNMLQLENPYTGEIITTVDDWNKYVDQYNSELEEYESIDYIDDENSENEDYQDNYVIVYWTPNGECYHSSEYCRTLSRSKTILSGTIDEAINSGHGDPCNVCY